MRKLLTSIASVFITGSLLAGGLVTNNNQSAMFTRLQNRNASTGIDAVYYNPAGLTKLKDGFHVSINNQTISQTQTVINNYTYLSGTPKRFVGEVSAPVFPGIYVAYKTGRLALSAGFNPVGGGGSAEYSKGLPSFEMKIADLVPLLNSNNIPTTKYGADIYFKGSSIYFGYQVNASYKLNDIISFAAGIRMVTAKNTYKGYLKNISIDPVYPAFGSGYTGGMVLANQFFSDGSTVLNSLASSANTASAGLTAAIGGGLSAATPLSAMPAATVAGVTQLLGAAGISATGMNIGTAAATLNAVAPVFSGKATTMASYAASTADITVDAKQTGTGYTPIISANISPSENLDISIKYEFKTKLELTTKVANNEGAGIFIDGAKVIADIPAIFSLGFEYKPVSKLSIAGTFNYYFDKNVDYDGSADTTINMIDKNFIEYGLGAEYAISEKLRISAGWIATHTGVNSNYQSDMGYSTNTNSFGAGFGYHITPAIDFNLGGSYSFYADGSKTFTHMLGTSPIPVTETYKKSTWIISAGLDFSFGK
jgi:long-chain fatty acid transport protein